MVWLRRLNKEMPNNMKSEMDSLSLLKHLRECGKITPEFEVMLSGLTLEELIALKLETASKLVKGKLYGIPIWKSIDVIIKDAILKFAISVCHSKVDASRFLGISKVDFEKTYKRYNLNSYFNFKNKKEK